MPAPIFAVGSQSFTVPATAGNYATERLSLTRQNTSLAPANLVGVTALIESNTATGASLELWVLKVGGDPTNDAHYFNSGKSISAGSDTWPLASWPGAQLRAKSGGVSGALVASGTADVVAG